METTEAVFNPPVARALEPRDRARNMQTGERRDKPPAAMLHRDEARLLVLDRRDGSRKHAHFRDLLAHLPPRALLVLNDTRVLPARLLHEPIKTGGSKGMLSRLPEMLPTYYELRGWDANGVPTPTKLGELGLTA